MNQSQQDNLSPCVLDRVEVKYDELPDLRDELIIKDRTYRQQYANMYYVRLMQLRATVFEIARAKWENFMDDGDQPYHVDKILDVKPGQRSSVTTSPRDKYCSEEDVINIEDESGRVRLVGDIIKEWVWVTGLVVAVLGRENSVGAFEVMDICLPGLPPQPPSKLMETDDSGPRYVALLSGMNLDKDSSLSLKSQMLIDYLTGELGTVTDQTFSSKVSRLIIAGNALKEGQIIDDTNRTRKSGNTSGYDNEPIQELDNILETLSSTLSVDLMPGNNDPASFTLPQQPIHKNLFPKAAKYPTFSNVTNPYWGDIDGIVFLGTSGQTIDDLYKYVHGHNRLEITEKTLYWRHIAPTAPDTLWCYPFIELDPFVLTRLPHVYFIGNQKEYATSLVEGPDGRKTRIILLPSFAETGTIVLVNLSTLECQPMSFSTDITSHMQ
ncbi:7560_t:CDS:10 [Paraglomus occultum]|uniref:7560_t:CDS:1 n=1 Tax=Paraglomus occultum TaxID=144539 RepID=A0A9N9A7W9_9GLOM|nr:7560_t:CDS:10 [Paraglomus occultum]